jgi:hypothetical protein
MCAYRATRLISASRRRWHCLADAGRYSANKQRGCTSAVGYCSSPRRCLDWGFLAVFVV